MITLSISRENIPELHLEVHPVAVVTRQTRAIIDREGYLALEAQLAKALGYDQILPTDLPDDFQIGPVGREEVTRQFYRINGCPSGTLLPHNGNSSAIQGFFWPMGMQPQDNLWYARPYDMNNAMLVGPEEETFTGKAVLAIFHFPRNPIQINP
jgi:hypothetical protein